MCTRVVTSAGWLFVQVQGLPSYVATNLFTNLATWLRGSVTMVTVCTPTRMQCRL